MIPGQVFETGFSLDLGTNTTKIKHLLNIRQKLRICSMVASATLRGV